MSRQSITVSAVAYNVDKEDRVVASDVEKNVEKNLDFSHSFKKKYGYSRIFWIVSYYALCSSTMLIINKVAIHHVKAPTLILFCQLLTSAAAVFLASAFGLVTSDPLERGKVRKFAWVVVGFLGTIFANIKVLQNANVETFITFRSSAPIVLSLCDYFFLGRQLPSRRSWFCLLVLVLGSVGYVYADADFRVDAYGWLLVWFVFFTFDSVYVKHMCNTVRMTNWGRVYYTNLLALLPLLLTFPFVPDERLAFAAAFATPSAAHDASLRSASSINERTNFMTARGHVGGMHGHRHLLFDSLTSGHQGADRPIFSSSPSLASESSTVGVVALVLSCIMGLGMSHASYLLRESVSATMFTLVGIVCKIGTVIINCTIWSNHATPAGIACLMLCVLAGTFYEQAPMRRTPP